MFLPWLPFLTFPEAEKRSRRRRRFRVFSPDAATHNQVLLCSVELFHCVPGRGFSPAANTPTRNRSNRSLHSHSPTPSNSSARSPRPCSSGTSSQPTSARDKILFAPPPEPKANRFQRKGLETSSAMLELFGGGGFTQVVNSKLEPEAVKHGAPGMGERTKPRAPSPKPNSVAVPETRAGGASPCFQEIKHSMEDKHFGRKNVLERENAQKSEHGDVRVHASTSSAFETIGDHDAKYAECRQRSAWEHSHSHFNVVESTPTDPLALPGPEQFDDNEETAAVCPAAELLNDLDTRQHMRCNLAEEQEPTVSEEFISDAEVHRKRRSGSDEAHAAEGDNFHHKDALDQMQLSNPGPELDDYDEEARVSSGSAGQNVVMDAEKEDEEAAAEVMCACKDNDSHAVEDKEGEQAASGSADMRTSPNGDESIAPVAAAAGPATTTKAELLLHADAVFESATAVAVGTLVATGGSFDGANYTVNNKVNGSSAPANGNRSGDRAGTGGSGAGVRGSNMVSLTGSGGSGKGSDGAGSGGDRPLLIRGGQIVNDDSLFAADILVENGTIKQVSPSLEAPENAEVIEAAGHFVLPAGIDVHTEFSIAGTVDDFGTGSKAALAGGTATIIDVVHSRPEDSLISAFDRTKQQAAQRSVCNFGLSVVISKWSDVVKSEMELLVREKGVNSFILDLFSDSDLFAACEHAKDLGAHVRVLPDNRDVATVLEKKVIKSGITGPEGYAQSRPAQLEADKVQHLSIISNLTNCPMTILSVTSSEAARAINQGRRDGALVSAEVPVAAITGPNPKNPALLMKIPLREGHQHTNDALETLANGPLSMCVSDHCTPSPSVGANFTRLSKGVAGVEERMMVLWEKAVTNGRIDPMRFVAVTSSNAAKAYNLYPKKGRIAVGADADIVVWDLKAAKRLSVKTHLSKTDSSLYEGVSVRAQPLATICAGKVLYRDGKHVGAIPGMGAFLNLRPNSAFMFSVVRLRENMNGLAVSNVGPDTGVRGRVDDDRPLTGSGARPTQAEQAVAGKPRTKVTHPPGGKSSGFW